MNASEATYTTPNKDAKSPSQASSSVGFARFLDYETVKLTVALRYEQEKCRKAIKNQLREKNQLESEHMLKIREECQRGFQEQHEKCKNQRRKNEELISRKAEQHALQNETENQRKIEAIHIQTRRAMRLVIFNGISQCQEVFREKYSAVIKLLLACQRSDYNKSLKELVEQFEKLISKLKNNDYGAAELKTAHVICESLEALERKIKTEIEQFVKEEERRRQHELQQLHQKKQQLIKQQQQQRQQQTQQQHEEQQQTLKSMPEEKSEIPLESAPATTESATAAQQTEVKPASNLKSAANINDDGLSVYSQIMSYYHTVVEKVKPLKNDDSLKKYRFACQKAINMPINTISAVSPQHLQDKFEKLYAFINGQPSNEVRTTDHPLGRDYCLLLVAKKFVGQGATAVSSNQQAAFPLAAVLVTLWKFIPELGQLYLAYLYKESPYMVPCYLKQQEGQSPEDFLKQLGYHFTNGQIEPSDLFLKRQAGIARLYAACIVTNGRQMDGSNHPYGLNHAWRWLAKIVKMEPLPDLSATIIMEFLQIVGGPMLKAYGKQFIKLLVFVQRTYFPQLAAVDKGGPKARLELQLNKFLQEGRIESPAGMLPAGYW